MNRNNPDSPPTPLGELSLLSRDTFAYGVFPHLDIASRRALALTSRKFYQLINSCELAYLADMPTAEQVASLCRLAMHLNHLKAYYTANPFQHRQDNNNNEDAIKQLVITRLRYAMSRGSPNNLVAALTLTCLAHLDPNSMTKDQALRALAFDNIESSIANFLRKLCYPANHPIVSLMPEAFKLHEYISRSNPRPVRELCKAIANPHHAYVLQEHDAASEMIAHSGKPLTADEAYVLFSHELEKSKLEIICNTLERLDLEDVRISKILYRYIVQSKKVSDAFLKVLPTMAQKWKTIPHAVLEVLQDVRKMITSDRKIKTRYNLPTWYEKTLALLIRSTNLLVAEEAWEFAYHSRHVSSKAGREFTKMIVSAANEDLIEKFFNRDRSNYSNTHFVRAVFQRIEPAIADKHLIMLVVNFESINIDLSFLVNAVKAYKSKSLSSALYLQLIKIVNTNKHNDTYTEPDTLLALIHLLPEIEDNLETLIPLLTTVIKHKPEKNHERDALPVDVKTLLSDWFHKRRRLDHHFLQTALVTQIAEALSPHQASVAWSHLLTHANDSGTNVRSVRLRLTAILLINLGHKLSGEELLNSKSELMKSFYYIDDQHSDAVKKLARHLCVANLPRLALLSLLSNLITIAKPCYAQIFLHEIGLLSKNLNETEKSYVLDILITLINRRENADDGEKILSALTTLNAIATSLTPSEAMRVINNFSGVLRLDNPLHLKEVIAFIILTKDKIPLVKNHTHNFALTRITNMLVLMLDTEGKQWDLKSRDLIKMNAVAALCQFVEHLTADDIAQLTDAYYVCVKAARDMSKFDFECIFAVLRHLTPNQARKVITDIGNYFKLEFYRTPSTILFFHHLIPQLYAAGLDDCIPLLGHGTRLAACTTELTASNLSAVLTLTLEDKYRLIERSREALLADWVCSSPLQATHSLLENMESLVGYIKAINHLLGTSPLNNDKTRRFKKSLAHQTLVACLNRYPGDDETKFIMFQLTLLQLAVQANHQDLEFLFRPAERNLSIYARYMALSSRIQKYCLRYRHDISHRGFTPSIIHTLAGINDSFIPHVIMIALLAPTIRHGEVKLNEIKRRAIESITHYCAMVDNIDRLDELMFLILDHRKSDLAPILMRKYVTSLSIHGHGLKAQELSQFGIFQNERCTGTAVKIINIIQQRRLELLRLQPNAPLLQHHTEDEDGFIMLVKKS